jgi:hypothetical protein
MNSTQRDILSKRLADELIQQWPSIETELLSVAHDPDFATYLREYRGIAGQLPSRPRCRDMGRLISDSLLSRLTDCLRSSLSSETLDNTNWAQILHSFEGLFNLALYFWHAPSERNFQFRTVVHFSEIAPEPVLVRQLGVPEFFLRITEWGVQFSSTDDFAPFPFRHSLAMGCHLSGFSWDCSSESTWVANALAKIRVVQREFCQLIDEWEHCNSILAHKQFSLKNSAKVQTDEVQQQFSEIARSRDLLAHWCATSAADFQVFVSDGLSASNLHPDLQAELAAVDALLLAGFQKFFLPASVSRHVYSSDVIEVFSRFTQERLRVVPDDVYCVLSQLSFNLALDSEVDWQKPLSLLGLKSFNWSLSADPSAAIKSVAWAFTPEEHQLLTACFVFALQAKSEPNCLDSYWLQSAAGLVEMPGTFMRGKKSFRRLNLPEQQRKDVLEKAQRCFAHFESDTNSENNETARYISEFLRSDLSLP